MLRTCTSLRLPAVLGWLQLSAGDLLLSLGKGDYVLMLLHMHIMCWRTMCWNDHKHGLGGTFQCVE